SNQFSMNNNNSMHFSNKTFHDNNINNNRNKNLNYFTDYSIDDSTTTQNSKVNLYMKILKK
ncbi:hypothetical protein, partial [Ruminococcus sp.]|uniref:hypothetical protein n=1 Tax=Ruminococcus sp. TaxID=41978 RepID=UPI002E8729C5|nr:hypothetical protein [Ruminococcus sp.]